MKSLQGYLTGATQWYGVYVRSDADILTVDMGTKKHRKKNSAKKPFTVKLKAEIEEEMKRSGYHRGYRNNSFVSIGFIKNLFKSGNPPKLQRSIQADLENLKREEFEQQDQDTDIEKLVAHVTDEASKLYAVLLLVGHSQRIFKLSNTDHPITDRIFEKGENSCDVPYCSLQYLKAKPQMSDIAEKIFEKQWCIPPILRREIDQKYPIERFRFPFQGQPKKIDRGGIGGVFKVKVAEGHLEAGDQNYVRVSLYCQAI